MVDSSRFRCRRDLALPLGPRRLRWCRAIVTAHRNFQVRRSTPITRRLFCVGHSCRCPSSPLISLVAQLILRNRQNSRNLRRPNIALIVIFFGAICGNVQLITNLFLTCWHWLKNLVRISLLPGLWANLYHVKWYVYGT